MQRASVRDAECARLRARLTELKSERAVLETAHRQRLGDIARHAVRWQLAAMRFRHALAASAALLGKANFNPLQPRVPRGHDGGGRWAKPGAQFGSPSKRIGFAGGRFGGLVIDEALLRPAVTLVANKPTRPPTRLTVTPLRNPEVSEGQTPGIGHNGGPPLEEPPKIPKLRPPTAALRRTLVNAAARWLVRATVAEAVTGPAIGTFLATLDAAVWIYQYYPEIQAYLDAPKDLGELQKDLSKEEGYHIHHIVEQKAAADDKYPGWLIHSSENLVRIPAIKHREITGWYQRHSDDSEYLRSAIETLGTAEKVRQFDTKVSPRDRLRGTSWEVRRRVGLDILIQFGVLKP